MAAGSGWAVAAGAGGLATHLEEQVASCGICFLRYTAPPVQDRVPLLMPCAHTFCATCLHEAERCAAPAPLCCPICRAPAGAEMRNLPVAQPVVDVLNALDAFAGGGRREEKEEPEELEAKASDRTEDEGEHHSGGDSSASATGNGEDGTTVEIMPDARFAGAPWPGAVHFLMHCAASSAASNAVGDHFVAPWPRGTMSSRMVPTCGPERLVLLSFAQYNATADVPLSWMSVDLGPAHALVAEAVWLRHGNPWAGHRMRDWALQGSNDCGATWETLVRKRADNSILGAEPFAAVLVRGIPRAFGAFRSFRLLQLGANTGGVRAPCSAAGARPPIQRTAYTPPLPSAPTPCCTLAPQDPPALLLRHRVVRRAA